MNPIWRKILYVLSFWIYFMATGVTEAMTWKGNINPDIYHYWRAVEWAGLIALFISFLLVNGIQKTWENLKIAICATISGVGIYELVFCKTAYGDWMYHKTSRWLFISEHPSNWFWIGLIIVCSIFIIIMIRSKKN